MPDGDRVHSRLSYHYHKVYKQICDGQFGYEAMAREVSYAMIKDIRKYGNEPITLIRLAVAQLEQIPTEPLFKEIVDWAEESRAIEKLSQQIYGKTRAIDLAVKACKDYLHELRYELQYGNHQYHIFFNIVKKYLWNVYQAEFEAKVPTQMHYKGVDREIVNARLTEMQPYVMQKLESFASQIVKRKNVNLLHLPRHTKPKQSIDMDTDVFQLVG